MTGAVKKLVALGSGVVVSDPWFSADGTRILFASDMQGLLWIMNADGSGLRQLTPTPLQDITWWDFTPDGRSTVAVSTVAGLPTITIANLDGSGSHTLDLGKPVGEVSFQPPDGKQILVTGQADATNNGELYVVNADGSNLRTVARSAGKVESAGWSPDGSKIVYGDGQRIQIMSADGSNVHPLHPDAPGWEGWPRWSPDGTRMVFQRWDGTKLAYAVARADGTGPIVAMQSALDGSGASYEWSPDSSVILARPNGTPRHELWDPTTGTVRAAPWTAATYPAWQRLAP